MKKIFMEVSATPAIHEGQMKHYWCVKMATDDGIFILKDGWNNYFEDAVYNACETCEELEFTA